RAALRAGRLCGVHAVRRLGLRLRGPHRRTPPRHRRRPQEGDMSENTEIRKGLNGVVADVSAISKVNSETNSLLYRGYPVPELAATQSFEAVAYLLWNGELPTADHLSEAIAHERSHRALDGQVRTALDALPADCQRMDSLRTAVSVLGAVDPTAQDSSPEAEREKARRLFAQLPAVIAYEQRRRRAGGATEPVAPREDL